MKGRLGTKVLKRFFYCGIGRLWGIVVSTEMAEEHIPQARVAATLQKGTGLFVG